MTEEGVDLKALYECLDSPARKRYAELKQQNQEEAKQRSMERIRKRIEEDSKIRVFFAKSAVAVLVAFLMIGAVALDFKYVRVGFLAAVGIVMCGFILSTDW